MFNYFKDCLLIICFQNIIRQVLGIHFNSFMRWLKLSLVSALTLNYIRYYNNITASIKCTMDTMPSKFVVTRVAENSCPSFHSKLTPTNFTFMHLTISSPPPIRLGHGTIII